MNIRRGLLRLLRVHSPGAELAGRCACRMCVRVLQLRVERLQYEVGRQSRAQKAAWNAAVYECYERGFLQAYSRNEMIERNPFA